MKPVYVVRKVSRYGVAPINIRAFETMADAEDLVGVFKRAGVEDIDVIPLELSPASAAAETPQPAMQSSRDRLGPGLRFTHTQVVETPEAEDAA